MTTRRMFLGCAAAAATTAAMRPAIAQSPSSPTTSAPPHPLLVFAKPLEQLEWDELGKRLQSLGVQGIEATLRPEGQIDPTAFAQKLPRLCDTLAKHDQRIVIAATAINAVTADSEQQLRLLSKAEIPQFRMQYYHYDFSRPVLPQLDEFARQASDLAALCRSLDIQALYQNHAGQNYVGSALWDLQHMLRDIDPKSLAVAYDVRHAALELSQSWRAGYAAIRPHIGAIYVKDVAWVNNQPEDVALGAGIAKPLFEAVKREGLIGPLSLHVEYLDHRDASLQEQRWQAVVQDVATLRAWLA